MRGNCFESEQIWWREIRADDGGGGVIRIRVGGRGLKRVEGCGGGRAGVGGGGGGRGGRWGWWVRAFARTPYDCVCLSTSRLWNFSSWASASRIGGKDEEMGGLDNGRHGERTRAEGVTLKDRVWWNKKAWTRQTWTFDNREVKTPQ